jgi:hypothetical protein
VYLKKKQLKSNRTKVEELQKIGERKHSSRGHPVKKEIRLLLVVTMIIVIVVAVWCHGVGADDGGSSKVVRKDVMTVAMAAMVIMMVVIIWNI